MDFTKTLLFMGLVALFTGWGFFILAYYQLKRKEKKSHQ